MAICLHATMCPIHHAELQCTACIGAKGGRVVSPKKLRQLRKAAKRPRPGARGKAKPRLRDKPKAITTVPPLDA